MMETCRRRGSQDASPQRERERERDDISCTWRMHVRIRVYQFEPGSKYVGVDVRVHVIGTLTLA